MGKDIEKQISPSFSYGLREGFKPQFGHGFTNPRIQNFD